MRLFRFFAYLLIWLIAWPLTYILAPIAAVTAQSQTGRLPWILQWMETHDAPGWEGPQTEHATAKHSRRVGLMLWLMRNKAYRLRWWMRARPIDMNNVKQWGTVYPPKYGPSFWLGSVDGYFEFQPRLSWGGGYLFARLGWKMKPAMLGIVPDESNAAGIFSFSPLRHDDWDDFPGNKPPERQPF